MDKPSGGDADTPDDIDRFRQDWTREASAIDTEPMAIFGRINRIAHQIAPSIEAMFARYGIDRGEFDVIATLRRSGAPYCLTPTEIYRSLVISSGGLTHRLNRLEKAGLVTRHTSAADRRSLLVQLTDKGAALASAAFAEDMKLEKMWMEGLSSAERNQLSGLLRKLLLCIRIEAAD